jgi:hypothetical protein
VLREESDIDRNKSKIEMNLSKELTINHTSKERKSVEEPTKNSKDDTHSKNVMEMSYNVISVMKSNINGRVGKHDTGKTTKSKKKDETFNPKHRHSRGLIIPTVNCGQPRKDLNPRRNSNSYSCGSKIGTSIDIHTNGKHVVSSNNITQETNGNHSVDHTVITEDLTLTGVGSNNLRDNPETRKN